MGFRLLLVLMLSAELLAGEDSRHMHRRVVDPAPSHRISDFSQPASTQLFRPSSDPSRGDTLAFTNYDYGWNSGSRQMGGAYFSTAGLRTIGHFTFMHRLPGDPFRRQGYVYYDGSSYALSLLAQNSGFGSLDVFLGGLLQGGCVLATKAVGIAMCLIDSSGTAIHCSDLILPFPRPNVLLHDPTVAVRRPTNIIWLVVTANREDLWLFRTTDLGTSWQFVDSLAHHAPFQPQGLTLDVPLVVRDNGDVYVFVALTGDGELPPLGNGTPDSCDRIGYFKSTDDGLSWTFVTVARDGEALLPNSPTEFFIPENFGQLDGVVDDNGVVHIVFNGYAIDTVSASPRATYRTMYWNSATGTFRNISREQDTHSQWNSEGRRSGNALGRCYPTIAYDPTSNLLFAAWSEPQIVGSRIDTSTDGRWYYDVWHNWSGDGGFTWQPPVRATMTDSVSEIFTTTYQRMTRTAGNGNGRWAHVVYLADSRNGCYVFGEGQQGLEPWIYRTVDLTVVSVGDTEPPQAFALRQNYPNPFNPETTIDYRIPNRSHTKLTVYDVLGRNVDVLVDEVQEAGNHTVTFNGNTLASGMYFYRLQTPGFVETKKMLLMK